MTYFAQPLAETLLTCLTGLPLKYAEPENVARINQGLELCRNAHLLFGEHRAASFEAHQASKAILREAKTVDGKITAYKDYCQDDLTHSERELYARTLLSSCLEKKAFWVQQRQRFKGQSAKQNQLHDLERHYQPLLAYSLYNVEALIYIKGTTRLIQDTVEFMQTEAEIHLEAIRSDTHQSSKALRQYVHALQNLNSQLQEQYVGVLQALQQRADRTQVSGDILDDDPLMPVVDALKPFDIPEFKALVSLTPQRMTLSQRAQLSEHAQLPVAEGQAPLTLFVYKSKGVIQRFLVPLAIKAWLPRQRPAFYQVDQKARYKFFAQNEGLCRIFAQGSIQGAPVPQDDTAPSSHDMAWVNHLGYFDSVMPQLTALLEQKPRGFFNRIFFKGFDRFIDQLYHFLLTTQTQNLQQALNYIEQWWPAEDRVMTVDHLDEMQALVRAVEERIQELPLVGEAITDLIHRLNQQQQRLATEIKKAHSRLPRERTEAERMAYGLYALALAHTSDVSYTAIKNYYHRLDNAAQLAFTEANQPSLKTLKAQLTVSVTDLIPALDDPSAFAALNFETMSEQYQLLYTLNQFSDDADWHRQMETLGCDYLDWLAQRLNPDEVPVERPDSITIYEQHVANMALLPEFIKEAIERQIVAQEMAEIAAADRMPAPPIRVNPMKEERESEEEAYQAQRQRTRDLLAEAKNFIPAQATFAEMPPLSKGVVSETLIEQIVSVIEKNSRNTRGAGQETSPNMAATTCVPPRAGSPVRLPPVRLDFDAVADDSLGGHAGQQDESLPVSTYQLRS